MTWEDRYVRGSFRGLEFRTLATTVRAGQRRAVYEIPFDNRGVASVALGRKPRKYAITCVLLDADVDQKVTEFLAALEQPEPGLLVHPYLGRVMVVPADEVSVQLSTAQGGMAEISFEATESRAAVVAQGPAATASTRPDVYRWTGVLRQANEDAFTNSWSLEGVSDFVSTANISTLDTVLTNLAAINAVISRALAIPQETASQITAIALQIVDLAKSPQRLYETIAGAMETTYAALALVSGTLGIDVAPDGLSARPDAVSVSIASLKAAIESSDLTSGSPPAGLRDTPARERERTNRAALDQAMQAGALAAIIDAANKLTLPSAADNETVRDMLLDALDALFLQELQSAAVADALQDVRGAVWARFTAQGTAITEFTPGDNMPADVLAWQLYGDAERGQEIVERNDVSDPGELPGLVALEVLIQ
jgi:prophage DNA circulation protein